MVLSPASLYDAGRAARRKLDDGRDHLDDPAVEIDGAAGWHLVRAFLPSQHRRVDERGGIAPVHARVDLLAVHHDVELGFHAADRHGEALSGGLEEGPRPAAPPRAPPRRRRGVGLYRGLQTLQT